MVSVVRKPYERLGMIGTRVYRVWGGMRRRCLTATGPDSANYLARGIVVCPEWESFGQLFADMGHPPDGHSLERKDNNRPYARWNCKRASLAIDGRDPLWLRKEFGLVIFDECITGEARISLWPSGEMRLDELVSRTQAGEQITISTWNQRLGLSRVGHRRQHGSRPTRGNPSAAPAQAAG
jgi:hypothetical protein